MGHTYTHLLHHIVFSTKDRIPYLKRDVREPAFSYMAGIARKVGATDVLINGMADHVHVFLKLPPQLSVSEAVQKIKASSSKWAHEERVMPQSFGWQTGYSAFSVSQSNALDVVRYIEDQEAHHH